ncbi:MAG TPA: 5-formyltetrahydrofolate cyclo-ligase [Longimicrobium sp.]
MTKDEFRREARRRMRDLLPSQRAAAETEIARLVWTVPEVAAARTLLLYAHLPDEVSTDAIALDALTRGVHVVFPRVLPDSRALDLHTVAEPLSLRIGAYGIREPDPERCARVFVEAVDAVLVPGLAWDRRGARLGRGAGYYDRLFALPEWRGFRCGVFYGAQEFPALPTDPWDVPLQAVVTEGGVVAL